MTERDPIFGYCVDCPRAQELGRTLDKEASRANKDSWVPLLLSELGSFATEIDCDGPITDRTQSPEMQVCAVVAVQPNADEVRKILFEE